MNEHTKDKKYATVFERLNISSHALIKSLEENKPFYRFTSTIYAIEDALSYSFGNLKLYFSILDSYAKRSDANAQDEWHAAELTPEGLAATIAVSVFLMVFLGLGTYFADDEDLRENNFKYYTVKLAPYLRDSLQAIKWAYKGLRSGLAVIFTYVGTQEEMYQILFPIAITLAVVAMINRIFLRYMRNDRKDLQKINKKHIEELVNSQFTYETWQEFNHDDMETKPPSIAEVALLYTATCLGAVLDSIYFYLGSLFLVPLSPSLFIVGLAFASILFISCLATRIYEEYDYQRTYDSIRLELELTKNKITCKTLVSEINTNDQKELLKDLRQALKTYQKNQLKLEQNTVISIYSAILQGLKNGLAVQGVISAAMLFGSMVMALCGISCPPIFIISMMATGLFCLTVVTVSYIIAYQNYKDEVTPIEKINLDNLNQEQLLQIQMDFDQREIKKAPNLLVIEYSELCRLFLSGFIKAQKNFYEFTYDHNNRNHNIALFIASMLFSIFIAVVFVFRTIKKMFTGLTDGNPSKSARLQDDYEEGEIPQFGLG